MINLKIKKSYGENLKSQLRIRKANLKLEKVSEEFCEINLEI
jgi:hypothetical protein